MTITNKSDDEIINIVQPMIESVVNASNQRDWDQFSQYQTDEERRDPGNRQNVERLWKEEEFFTSLNDDIVILGVLRKGEVAQLIWKQTSSEVPGDGLARYFVKEINQEIKEVGFLIDWDVAKETQQKPTKDIWLHGRMVYIALTITMKELQ